MVTRTFSKIYGMAALRLGCFFHQPLSPIFNRFWFQEDERTISALTAAAGTAALKDNAHISLTQRRVLQARDQLVKFAEQNHLKVVGDHGNFVTFLFANSTRQLRSNLAKAGYAVDQGLENHYLRVTLGSDESLRSFSTALLAALN